MKKIKQVFLLIIFVGILMFDNCVNASSFNFIASTDATSIEPGDTVKIEFSVSNIDAGETGINTIEAVLEYDETIFEPVTSSDFSGLNNWSITYNGEEGENKGKFIAVIVQDGVTEDQAIGTLTLRAKTDITDQTTDITIKDIKTNDGTEEITTQNQVISMNIKNPVVEDPNGETNNQPSNTIGQTSNANTVGKDESLSPNILPAAGSSYLLAGIVLFMVVMGIIAYIGYRKTKI